MTARESPGLSNVRESLTTANLLSFLGIAIVEFAVPFLAVSQLDAGPVHLAVLGIARFLPSVLLAEWVCRVVERRGCRSAMAYAEVVRLGAFVVIALASASSLFVFGTYVLGVALLSAAGGMTAVAIGDAVPRMVDGEERISLYSKLSVSETVADASGPFLGGLLLGVLHPAGSFLSAAALAIVALVLVLRLPGLSVRGDSDGSQSSGQSRLRVGLAINFTVPGLRATSWWMIVYNFGQSLINALLLVVLLDSTSAPASTYGLLLGVPLAFAVAGAAAAKRLIERFATPGSLFQLLAFASLVSYGLIGGGLIMPTWLVLPTVFLCMALDEFCSAAAAVLVAAFRAARIPPKDLASALAAGRFTGSLAVVAGFATGGALGEFFDPLSLILACGALMALLGLLLFRSEVKTTFIVGNLK